MKKFLELLGTPDNIVIDLQVEVAKPQQIVLSINRICLIDQFVTQALTWQGSINLLEPFLLTIDHDSAYVKSLKFDGWEARPQWGTETPKQWQFDTNGAIFYNWKHAATGQGWLLLPQLI